MKQIYFLILCLCFLFKGYAQQEFIGKKGLKIFPGHLHAVVTVTKDSLHYQLFNHWYSKSYEQLRDLKFSVSDLQYFTKTNDTLRVSLENNVVKLNDIQFKLKRALKNKKLCTSVSEMRKIAYAYQISREHAPLIKHYQLFTPESLKLSEEDFKLSAERLLEELLLNSKNKH